MEKLQLMMFEVLGFKLKFSQKVTEQYFNTVTTRFGSGSQIEQEMRSFVSDSQKQQEIISNPKHIAYNEFKLLAKMQLKQDIAKISKKISDNKKPEFLKGYQFALAYLQATATANNLSEQDQTAAYQFFQAIQDSEINPESSYRQTTKGVDSSTIRIVFRTMICFNEALVANKANYIEAKNTVKTLFKLCVKAV